MDSVYNTDTEKAIASVMNAKAWIKEGATYKDVIEAVDTFGVRLECFPNGIYIKEMYKERDRGNRLIALPEDLLLTLSRADLFYLMNAEDERLIGWELLNCLESLYGIRNDFPPKNCLEEGETQKERHQQTIEETVKMVEEGPDQKTFDDLLEALGFGEVDDEFSEYTNTSE